LFEKRFTASKNERGLQGQSCSVLPNLKGKQTFVHIPDNTQLTVYSAFAFKKQLEYSIWELARNLVDWQKIAI